MIDQVEERFVASNWLLYPSTLIVRRCAFSEVGFFNVDLASGEDTEFMMRLLNEYSLGVVERPLVRYRLHDRNTHKDKALLALNMRRFVTLMATAPDRYPPARGACCRERSLRILLRYGQLRYRQLRFWPDRLP